MSTIGILRARGYGFGWQLLALITTGSQVFALYFFGEARTYVLLAAAVGVTAWVYAQRNPNLTKVQALALFLAVSIGSLTHYFFVLYLFGIAVVFFLARPQNQESKITRTHLHPWFLALSLTLIAIANFRTFTIGRSQTAELYDSFEYTRTEGGFFAVWADTHLQFLPLPKTLSVAVALGLLLLAISLLFIGIFRRDSRLKYGDFATATLYTSLLIVIPLIISALAVWADFQILNRQWVASILLFPTGVIWIAASLFGVFPSRARQPLVFVVVIFGVTCAGMFAWRIFGQLQPLL
jgi:hypothetical protein